MMWPSRAIGFRFASAGCLLWSNGTTRVVLEHRLEYVDSRQDARYACKNIWNQAARHLAITGWVQVQSNLAPKEARRWYYVNKFRSIPLP
ncbi:hypothetical protein BV25DRAFT_1818386 [Artomyces pyxidatus]|uniref:Uncharacterized protein n=1 Tax=Artomyces pyxidatus TaxID=48021 RepID=A0ACB8TI07_9AGAM|nr:hypothetical protein BV25DRAFT_1818386 [Artomyces pyxidatus]